MPRNRTELDREDKQEEILALAARRVQEGGYAGLSVAGIARELGLAPNSVYWYFKAKDELFVAAVARTIGELMAAKPPGSVPLPEKIAWFVEQLAPLDRLRADLHERGRESAPVRKFVEQLEHDQMRVLTAAMRDQVPDEELETAAQAVLSVVAGAAVNGLEVQERQRLVRYVLDKAAGS